MFEQHTDGFGLFIQGFDDIGNKVDRFFGNRVKHLALLAEFVQNLIMCFSLLAVERSIKSTCLFTALIIFEVLTSIS